MITHPSNFGQMYWRGHTWGVDVRAIYLNRPHEHENTVVLAFSPLGLCAGLVRKPYPGDSSVAVSFNVPSLSGADQTYHPATPELINAGIAWACPMWCLVGVPHHSLDVFFPSPWPNKTSRTHH